MERRRLGRIGHDSSVLIYGAASLGEVTQDVADESVAYALSVGLNHVDTAAAYGESELRLGAMMSGIRDRIFLATKTGDRSYEGAWASINRSLERLQTDRVDLLQLHEVNNTEQLDLCTREDGSLAAAERAKQEGLVSAVGITGHTHDAPATHLEALRRYPFATVLTPLNPRLWAEGGYRDDFEALAAEVRRQDVGLMVIKAVARRNWPTGAPRTRATWYEPLQGAEHIRAAVSWVLARPEVTGLATAGDVDLLAPTVAAEADRMPVEQAERVLAELPDYSSPFARMPF